jgi:hypothetical protein
MHLNAYHLDTNDILHPPTPHPPHHHQVKVNKDGSIETLSYTEAVASKAWRPGMMPLRDMKKHWTLQEFTAMDSTFNFTIKGGGKAHCKGVSLDMGECNGFQSYLREGEVRRGRKLKEPNTL